MGTSGPDFEEQVRSVARALWQLDPGQGAPEMVDGRERDCIFEHQFVTHYLEITTERSLLKVRSDAEKMRRFRDKAQREGRLVKLWIVTKQEPTADQRSHCRPDIMILSLKEFRRKVFDGTTYLELRPRLPFGSARDPATDSINTESVRYQAQGLRRKGTDQVCSIDDIAAALMGSQVVIVVGDYGMGKSIAIREVFGRLRKDYLATHEGKIPVAMNLRDCWGLNRPSEMLDRHARDVGLGDGTSLIRGYNAGQLVVLMDGFDETATTPWSTRERSRLVDLRHSAVSAIREIISASRGRFGVLVTGREHFFDSLSEMSCALGLRPSDIVLEASGLSEDEALEFVRRMVPGIRGLPDWLPRRPLLLASFAARGFLSGLTDEQDVAPEMAWLGFVAAVCEREAAIHKLASAEAIRGILEFLSSVARGSEDGLAPLQEADLITAFKEVTGTAPDGSDLPLLARLPGLAAGDMNPGTRRFVDDQFLETLRGSATARYIQGPRGFVTSPPAEWRAGLGELGVGVASRVLSSAQLIRPGLALSAARDALRMHSGPTLAIDCMQIARAMAGLDGELDCGGLEVEEGYTPVLDLTINAIPFDLRLSYCTIGRLVCIPGELRGLELHGCSILSVEGVFRREQLPNYVMDSCDIGELDALDTNAAMLRREKLDLPVRVLLTVLRKLYAQRGAGRRESAMFRGMSDSARAFVPDVLRIVQTEGLAFSATHSGQKAWHPVHWGRVRALRILEAMGDTSDPLVVAVQGLAE